MTNFDNTSAVFRSDSARSGERRGLMHLDSNDLAFFQRDLEKIDPTVY